VTEGSHAPTVGQPRVRSVTGSTRSSANARPIDFSVRYAAS
jgi:hypothetical protein